MKKKYIISVILMLFVITGCGRNDYQQLTKEVNKIFKNQPVWTDASIGIGDASISFAIYESVSNEQFYFQYGDSEIYTDGDTIWFTDSTGSFVSNYSDILKAIIDINDDFVFNRESGLKLPLGINKVDREFLLEYFVNPAYYSYDDNLLRNVVYQKENGLYTIEGQEKTIEFGLKDEVFKVSESGKHGFSTETHKVVTDYVYTQDDTTEIDDALLVTKIEASLVRNIDQYQNDISKYFDANPEAIKEMVKDNPVAAVKVFGEHILEENE